MDFQEIEVFGIYKMFFHRTSRSVNASKSSEEADTEMIFHYEVINTIYLQ